MRKLLSRLILIGIFLPVYSHAVGLGELKVNSSLNEPLNAEIDLVSVPASEIYSLEVRIAPAEVFDEIGIERPLMLTELEFDPQVQNGQTIIKVTSPQPVAEPFLNFVVEVTWPQGRFLREYTALLDPPSYNSTAVAAVAAPYTDGQTISSYDEPSYEYETYSTTDSGGEFVPYSEIDNGSYQSAGDTNYDDSSTYEGAGYSEETYTSYQEYEPYADSTSSVPTDIESLPLAQTFPLDGASDSYTSETYTETYTDSSYDSVTDTGISDEGYVPYQEYATDDATTYTDDPAITDSYDPGYTDYASTSDEGYYDVGFGEYSVEQGDILWNIAETHRSDNVTVSQMMIALLRANPEAFIDNNINQMKSGYVLRIPDLSEASSVPRSEAVAAVREQTDLWRQYRGTLSKVAVAQQSIGDNEAAYQPSTDNNSASEAVAATGDLEIVVPKANQGSAGTVLADAGVVTDRQEHVELAKEQVRSADREKAELASRVAELEGMLKIKDRLIDVQNEQLNELQRTVGDAEMAVEQAPVEEVVAEIPESLAEELVPPVPPAVEEALPSLEAAAEQVAEQVAEPEPTIDDIIGAQAEPPVAVAPTRSAPPPAEVEPLAPPEVVAASTPVNVPPASNDKTPWYLNKVFLAALAGFGLLTGIGSKIFRRRRDSEFEKAAMELQEYDGGLADGIEVLEEVKAPTGMLEMEERFSDVDTTAMENVEISNEDLVADAEKVLSEVDGRDDISELDDLAFGGEDELTQETVLTEENHLDTTDRINLEKGGDGFVPKVDADLSADRDLDDLGEDFTAELDATPFQEPVIDVSENEVLSELDIYLAYGLNDQVIDQAKQELEKEPGNHDYWLRLFKAYKEKGDDGAVMAFATDGAKYKEQVGKDTKRWTEIAVLGAAIDAQNPLYAEAGGSSLSPDELVPAEKPENLDIQFDEDKVAADNLETASAEMAMDSFEETQVIEPFGVSPEQHDALLGDDVDSIEDELVETVILEDSSLDELRAATSAGMSLDSSMADLEMPNATSEETSEFEYELSSIKGMDTAKPNAGADITEILPDDDLPSLDLDSGDDGGFSIDFDMPEVDSAGAAVAGAAVAGAGVAAVAGGNAPDLSQTIKISDDDKDELLELPEFSLDGLDDAMTGEDEMATKLDLAKAYVDMGDDEGARDALNEVISSGNDQQKVEAERLLNQLH